MIDKPEEERANAILALPLEKVMAAVTHMGHDIPCPTCGNEHWALASHDTTANVLNVPIANAPGLAHWFFYMTCKRCGAAKFIDAAYVLQTLQQEEQRNA